MGLSNEERLTKFFWTAMEWRKRLVQLTTHAERKAPVRRWIRWLDELVGMVQHAKSGGGSYWILGEDETALRGLMADSFGLEYRGDPAERKRPEAGTVEWHRAHFGIVELADRLTSRPYEDRKTVRALAAWWHAYDCVSAMAYPIFRYDDQLFSNEMKRAFRRLTGEMVNLRFEACCGLWAGDAELEQYLLFKTDVFFRLFDQHAQGLKDGAVFDIGPFVTKVAEMTPKELGEFFAAERQREYAARPFAPLMKQPDGLRGVTKPAAPEPVAPKASTKEPTKKRRKS